MRRLIIIMIIMIFISSAALSKIRRAAGTCHSVLTKRCAFRRRAKVAVDSVDRSSSAGKLFKSPDRKQQSSCEQWLWLSVARRVCRRRPTASRQVSKIWGLTNIWEPVSPTPPLNQPRRTSLRQGVATAAPVFAGSRC